MFRQGADSLLPRTNLSIKRFSCIALRISRRSAPVSEDAIWVALLAHLKLSAERPDGSEIQVFNCYLNYMDKNRLKLMSYISVAETELEK